MFISTILVQNNLNRWSSFRRLELRQKAARTDAQNNLFTSFVENI
jgi:hypothetical protein